MRIDLKCAGKRVIGGSHYTVVYLLPMMMFLLASIPVLNAQEYLFREVLSLRDLGGDEIYHLHQDSLGFLYISSENGLYLSDGSNIRQIPLPDSLDGYHATAFTSTDTENTIIGMNSGALLNYNIRNEMISFSGHIGKDTEIRDLLVMPEGTVWAASYGRGLICVEDSNVYFHEQNGLLSDFTYCLEPDELGRIWTGTDGGLNIITPDPEQARILSIAPAEGLADYMVTSIEADGRGRMIIGYESGEIEIIDQVSESVISFRVPENLLGRIDKILLLEEETIILSEGNCYVSEPGQGKNFRKVQFDDLPEDPGPVSDISVDPQGSLWITGKNSILISSGRQLMQYREKAGFTYAEIQAMLGDRSGNVWFSKGNLLFREDPSSAQAPVKVLQTASMSSIISLYEDINGFIWVGTFNDGLHIVDPETLFSRRFRVEEGLINNNILDMDGNQQIIWISSLGGVFSLSPDRDILSKETIQSRVPGEIKQEYRLSYVFDVYVQKNGKVWFGSDGGGLFSWSGETLNHHPIPGIDHPVIYSLASGPEENLWLAVAENGLLRYDGNEFTIFNSGSGLRSDKISGLVADGRDNLFITHDQGIDLFSIPGGTFSYLDDYAESDFRGFRLNSMNAIGEGGVLISSNKGIFRAEAKASFIPPKTIISSVELMNEKIDREKMKRWKYSMNNLRFRLSSICYSNPGRINFRFRLENLEPEWNQTRGSEVSYSALPPGEYRFVVQSSFNMDFRHSLSDEFSFTINKPFFRQIWFLIMVVIMGSSILLLIIRRRENNLKRREAIAREKLSLQLESLRNQVNPHFLFNSFNTLVSVIEENKDLAIDYVEKLSDFFRNVLINSSRDLISLKEEMQLLDSYVYLQKKRYGDRLVVETDVPEQFLKTRIPALSLQILAENAVKHNVVSDARPLQVRIRCSEEGISVENNLQLKRNAEPSTKTGLENIRSRYTMLGGSSVMVVQEKKRFIVVLPLILPDDQDRNH